MTKLFAVAPPSGFDWMMMPPLAAMVMSPTGPLLKLHHDAPQCAAGRVCIWARLMLASQKPMASINALVSHPAARRSV